MRRLFGFLSILLWAVPVWAQETKPAYPPLPEGFSSFGAATSEGFVYVYGGHVAKTHTYSTEAVTGKFRRLNLVDPAKGWEELPAGPGLQGLALVAHGGKLIRIGGMQPRNAPSEGADNISVASVTAFDPKSGKWEPLPDLPAPRSSHDAVTVGDRVVVIGGWDMKGRGNESAWHDTAVVLDLSKQPLRWEAVAQPFLRRALQAVAWNGKVYAFGGMTDDNSITLKVAALDVESKKWSSAPALPGPNRNGFNPAACLAGGRLYASPSNGKVYRLSVQGDNWEPVGALAKPRVVHRMVAVRDNLLLVIGGAGRSANFANLETVEPAEAIEGKTGASNWPGFRGTGGGVSTAAALPLKWSPTQNIAWKVDLPGYGQSAPVVWGGKVFVTSVSGDQREKGFVSAYDAATGKQLWSHEFEPTQKAKWSFTVSRAAPTPVVDAAGVYAFFEGGNLLAFSHDGAPRWSRSLVTDYGEFQGGHGIGGSPAQTADAVIVLVDHRGPSYLLAIDKKTGKTLWKTERPAKGSWTSPVVAERSGKQEIVVSSNGSVTGYDLSGAKLWEMEGVTGNTLSSASINQDLVLVGAGMSRMAGDPKAAAKSNCCLRLIEKDGKPGYELCWSAERATSNYATPLAHGGHAYFVNQVGAVFCVDLKTGQECYAERLDGACWASPIGAGDHVWFFGKDGRTTVIKTGPKFEKVATNVLWEAERKVPPAEAEPAKTEPAKKESTKGSRESGGEYLDPILYGVAATDGAFIIRTGSALYRVGKP